MNTFAAPSAALAIPFSFPGLTRVRCLFSTVDAGNMSPPEETVANRERFMRLAGFGGWAELNQVHGDRLVRARATSLDATELLERADGHHTGEPGLALVIKTADCQPILFAREDGGAVAALHVGWRGNAVDFPGTAVRRLCREFSCSPGNLLAVRGPSLGPAASEFVNFDREWPDGFHAWFDAAAKTVNLWELTRHQLEQAGLRRDRIFGLDMCTHTMGNTFYSYRRKDRGRQISAIWLVEE